MPRSATSMSPFLLVSAPVKAPRMWPKSSDSSSVSGSAPQLSATKGRRAASELKCTARATSSLPVPDSPVISIVLLVGATVSIELKTREHRLAAADDVRELVRGCRAPA